MRSLDTRRVVKAFMLHENMLEGPAVMLPLRRMSLKLLRRSLAPFRQPDVPPTYMADEALEGYVYDLAPGGTHLELTPFGSGLLALIDPGDETIHV
ncbi:hypothetical protein ACR6C2_08255 [Streptomyces sp. INA 01156]